MAACLSSKEGCAGWDNTMSSASGGACIDGMPVTGRPGMATVQVSEFLLHLAFPFLFAGPLPVTGVILAEASQSDLAMVASLLPNWGRVNFMDPVLLESSTEVLKTMGVQSSSLDIEMPNYHSSQSTLSQESRDSLPFDASDEDEQAARPRKRRRAAAKRIEPEVALSVEEKAQWCHLCRRPVKGGNLLRHMYERHKVGEPPEFLCIHCGKKFVRRENLEKRHKCKRNPATHPYTCEICSSCFKTDKQLHNHSKNGMCPKVTCVNCAHVFSEKTFPAHQAQCVA